MSIYDVWKRKSKIFIDESKLSIDYVPKKLPHRDDHLLKLASMFRQFINSPGSVSQKVLMIGPVGTGKTVVAKYFGKYVESFSRRENLGIRYVHVNCHKDRTLFLIMRRVSKELNMQIPRSFSSIELVNIVWSALENRNEYLLLVIDEADYLINTSGSEAMYDLTRISDEYLSEELRFSFIFILRDPSRLILLEECVRSSLMHNIIRFNPYTSKEIFDILYERVHDEEAMYPEAVSDDILKLIGELVGFDKGGKGDARQALEILWRAGKYAEVEDMPKILPEHVRKAYSDMYPQFSRELLDSLSSLRRHELLMLLAIARTLRLTNASEVALGEVEQEYRAICIELGERPRDHMKVWEYVQVLKNMGIITTRISGSGRRDKTTLISILSIDILSLEEEIKKHLQF